ncbi:MAG: PilT protein domain protein [Parcubacteria group bacterium GW2011_GWA1_38_7]|nr:MAG: PilT protein domain protein [Parcubacteria group bacterium GW2011_GWA1_38_7]
MKTYILDTNVFLRIFSGLDSVQKNECSLLLKRIEKGDVIGIVPNLVLSEIVWVLSSHYKHSKTDVISAVKSIINIVKIKFVDKSVKFIDSQIASIPQVYDGKWSVVSYDRDFDKLGVKRVEPKDLLSG